MITKVHEHFLALKAQFPDHLIFIRIGAFYEAFESDARIVARVCGLVPTSRFKSKTERTPCIGIAYHSFERYMNQLELAGYKIIFSEGNTDGK